MFILSTGWNCFRLTIQLNTYHWLINHANSQLFNHVKLIIWPVGWMTQQAKRAWRSTEVPLQLTVVNPVVQPHLFIIWQVPFQLTNGTWSSIILKCNNKLLITPYKLLYVYVFLFIVLFNWLIDDFSELEIKQLFRHKQYFWRPGLLCKWCV